MNAPFVSAARRPVRGLPQFLTPVAVSIHADNIAAGWWKQVNDDPTGCSGPLRTIPRNIGELLCLVHSEIDEASEGVTGGLMDDKLPDRPMAEVELADTAIRVLDILGYHAVGIDDFPDQKLRLPIGTDWLEWFNLMHGCVSQSMEGYRKGNTDAGNLHLVRLLGVLHHAALMFGLDLDGAITEKRAFNAVRADHKPGARSAAGGKQF